MATFAQRITSNDRIAVPPARVQEILVDPFMLAELTPLVASIDNDGHRWRWQLTGVRALGVRAAPEFTTIMAFTQSTIAFTPEPHTEERATASGQIDVTEGTTPDETIVAIDLVATVDLPLPQMTRRAVKTVMFQTMKIGGSRFAENLLAHLGNPWHRGLDVRNPP